MARSIDFVSIEKRVKTILEGFPVTRGDDKQLVAQYLRVYHNIESMADYVSIQGVPSLEAITRARRKVQSTGLFLPAESILRRRHRLAREMALATR